MPKSEPAPPPAMAAHRRIGDYLSRVADAISCSDGTALASLLAVSSPQASTPLTGPLAAFPDFPRLAADRFPNLADFLVPLLRTIHSHSLQRYADAYASFEKAAKFVPSSSRFSSICLRLPKI
jgi:nuclear mRNA export protein PCID2/THP1